jgi:hypothetical protein
MSVARPGWLCPGQESRVNLGGPVERLLVIDETPFEPNAGMGRMRRVRASADVDLPVCPHLLRDQQRATGADPASIRHNLPR